MSMFPLVTPKPVFEVGLRGRLMSIADRRRRRALVRSVRAFIAAR